MIDGPELIHGDRRSEKRYDSSLELRFGYKQWGFMTWGKGRTIDLSRNSICFQADQPVPDGVAIELQIDWPFRLHGIDPLVLRVAGVVCRSDERGIVLRIERREFVTAGGGSVAQLDGPTGFGLIA
jgi:hypothetical protein